MKKVIVVLVMALLTANSFGTWTPLQWDIKYDAGVLPAATTTPTPVQAWNGTAYANASRFTATGTAVPTVSGGIVSVNTVGTNAATYFTRNLTTSYPTGAVLPDSSIGYAVELSVKILDTEGASLGLLTVEEGTTGVTRSLSLGFYNVLTTINLGAGRILDPGTWVYLAGTGTQYTKVDAAGVFDFHTYRILADNAGPKLYIDGSTTVAQAMAWGATSKNGFIFGDQSSDADVSYELDYIGIRSAATLIPEPATVLVLGLGSLCLRLRRKLS